MRWLAPLVAVALGGCNLVFGLEAAGDDDVAIDASSDGSDAVDAVDAEPDAPRDGGGGGEVVGLAAGGNHTCVSRDRTVLCWGAGQSGQLGLASTVNIGDDEPANAVAGVTFDSQTRMVTAGADHTCALLGTGEVWCWGQGTRGRLGHGNDNTIGDNESPVSVGPVPLGTLADSVEAGGQHTCATTPAHTTRCWGAGSDGRLGYGNINDIGDNELPSLVGDIPGLPELVTLAAGAQHTCGLDSISAVTCWGSGANGRLGYGNINNIGDNEVPGVPVSVGGQVTQLVAGDHHTCALLTNGGVRCWGLATNGRLGYGNINNIGDNEVPSSAGDVNLGGAAVELAAGGGHTCAILNNGAVRCWGANDKGQLGYGNHFDIGDNETPASAGDVQLGGPATRIVAGGAHTCALLTSGDLLCWGTGGNGQLGYGNTNDIGDNETPANAGPVPLD